MLTGADCRRRQNTDESFNGRFRDECLNMEWCNNGVSPQAGGMPVCMSNLATATNALNAATNELEPRCPTKYCALAALWARPRRKEQRMLESLRKEGREVRRVDGNPHC